MKNRMIAITALLAVAVPISLHAQGAPAAQGKIGVMNVEYAIVSTAEGKKDFADLQKKYQPRSLELQNLQRDIQAISDQLSKGANTLSEDEQARLNRSLEEKQKLYKRSLEDFQNDSQNDQNEVAGKIAQKMNAVIGDFALKNGYTLILDNTQRIPVVAYGSKDVELTEAIVKLYDATYPVADAAAAKPAAAKPAAPAAATPKPKP